MCEIKEENNQQQLCRLGRSTRLGAVGKIEFRQITIAWITVPAICHYAKFTDNKVAMIFFAALA